MSKNIENQFFYLNSYHLSIFPSVSNVIPQSIFRTSIAFPLSTFHMVLTFRGDNDISENKIKTS